MKKIIATTLMGCSFCSMANLQTVDLNQNTVKQYSVSENGKYMVFTSDAALVPEDTDGVLDIYRKNLETGQIAWVSTDEAPYFSNSSVTNDTPLISNDGRYVAFLTKTSHDPDEIEPYSDDLYLKDMSAGTYERISKSILAGNVGASGDVPANRASEPVYSMTPDGRYVAFESTYVITGIAAAGYHLFLKDRANQSTSLIVALAHKPRISNDGRHVAFHSGVTHSQSPLVNGTLSVYYKDMATNTVELISNNADGNTADEPSSLHNISPDGRFVLFQSRASDLVTGDTNGIIDLFMKDRTTGEIQRISSQLDGQEITRDHSIGVSKTLNGSTVYYSANTSAISPDTTVSTTSINVYKRNLNSGEIELISRNPAGEPGNSSSFQIFVTPDEKQVYFKSFSNNLEPANGVLSNVYTYEAPADECPVQTEEIALLCSTLDETTRKKKNNKVKKRFRHLYQEGSAILELCPELSLESSN